MCTVSKAESINDVRYLEGQIDNIINCCMTTKWEGNESCTASVFRETSSAVCVSGEIQTPRLDKILSEQTSNQFQLEPPKYRQMSHFLQQIVRSFYWVHRDRCPARKDFSMVYTCRMYLRIEYSVIFFRIGSARIWHCWTVELSELDMSLSMTNGTTFSWSESYFNLKTIFYLEYEKVSNICRHKLNMKLP